MCCRLVVHDPKTIAPLYHRRSSGAKNRSSRTLLRCLHPRSQRKLARCIFVRSQHPKSFRISQSILQSIHYTRNTAAVTDAAAVHRCAALLQSGSPTRNLTQQCICIGTVCSKTSQAFQETHALHCRMPAPQTIPQAVRKQSCANVVSIIAIGKPRLRLESLLGYECER